jgi:hypothetical protein
VKQEKGSAPVAAAKPTSKIRFLSWSKYTRLTYLQSIFFFERRGIAECHLILARATVRYYP